MLRIHFTGEDLARTTLAEEPDPMWEVLLSLHQLQGRDGAAHYGGWRERARKLLPRPGDAVAATGATAWVLAGLPDRRLEQSTTFDEALERVLSTPSRRMHEGARAARRTTSSHYVDP